MPYQPNIPNATDVLRNSQGDIQGNFQAIYAAFDANHADFNAATAGQHNLVQMPIQPSVPNPPFATTDVALYNINSALTGISEIFLHPADASNVPADFPMTASILSYSAPATGTQNGWTYLPSGILLKWGTAAVTLPVDDIAHAVIFPVSANIPVFTHCLQVITAGGLNDVVSGSSAWSVNLVPGTITNTQFQYRMGYSSSFFAPIAAYVNYLAIGY